MTHVTNTPVNVNSYYFTGPELKTFPREIEFDGEAISFASGLRYLVRNGAEAIRLFDMSGADGRTYRLREDHGNWTLLKTSRPDLSVKLADDRRDKMALSATEAYLDMSKDPKAILAGEGSQIGANWGAMSLTTKGAF